MLQILMFLCDFCLITVSVKFFENDEGPLPDKITCYDHFMSYIFYGTTNTNTQNVTSFCDFFQVF